MRSGCLRGEQSVAQPCGLRTPAWENFTLPSVGRQELGGGALRGDGPCAQFLQPAEPTARALDWLPGWALGSWQVQVNPSPRLPSLPLPA